MSDRPSTRGGTSTSALRKSPMDQFLSLRTGLGSEGLPSQEQIDRVLAMLTEHPEDDDSGHDEEPSFQDESQFLDEPFPRKPRLPHESLFSRTPRPEPEPAFPASGEFDDLLRPPRTRRQPLTHATREVEYGDLGDEFLDDLTVNSSNNLADNDPTDQDLTEDELTKQDLTENQLTEQDLEADEVVEQNLDNDELVDDDLEDDDLAVLTFDEPSDKVAFNESSEDLTLDESTDEEDFPEFRLRPSFLPPLDPARFKRAPTAPTPAAPIPEPPVPAAPAAAPIPTPSPTTPSVHVPPPLPPLTKPTFTISAELPAEKPAPQPEVPSEPTLPDDRYSDRELSWLAFNNRVLDLAKDRIRVPLLERAKFLAIFSSNLDEFFMVRVAGLKRRIDAGLAQRGTSGLLPRELHDAILSTARDLVTEQSRVLTDEVLPELAAKGIVILRWSDLTDAEEQRLTELFRDRIYPILTPLAVDPSHPFPYISGLSLNLAVQLRNPETGVRLFARIKVPNVLPRFLQISEGRFVPLEDVISHHLDTIFTGMEILKHATFRVTRNEDVEVEEDDAENILFALETELLRRKVGRPPVRLEVQEDINSELLDTLATELDVTTQEIFFIKGPLDLTGLFSIADMDREDLKYPAFLPKTNPHLAEVETSQPADMFAALKKRDVLLHHPYDSFATSVQRFIEQAAADPQVLAIKQTLYRTSGDSPIVDALIEAARAGKQVLALVEIKARFDEQANIAWARKLEKSGVHVVYGLVGLKTHCKLSLVIRDEGETLRRYCHIGTGNYNPKTARMYEDMGLLTSNPIITDDVARLFNHLSGMTAESHYRRLLVSPFGIRNGLLEMIDHEIALQKSGTPGRIRIKVNSIVDEATMDALYRASLAGVKVDLWVRGICAMRGEVPGLSDNIRIRSVLGRFLEHSRLFWFDNGGNPQVGIGSADLMHRNLDRRVEVLVQLTNKEHIDEIDSLFNLAFADTTASWWLTGDGWVPRTLDETGRPLVDLQEYLIQATSARRTIA